MNLRTIWTHFLRWRRPAAPPPGWGAYAVNPRRLTRQWREGRWAYMGGLPELARYSLIGGYIQYYHPHARVLDVGCGEGLLAQRLGPGGYVRYLGLDIAPTAVDQATAKQLPEASFQCADVESFTTEERFDVIVLNEVLYYFIDPIPVLERLAGLLAPGGHFVGSMVVNERTAANWQLLERRFTFLDETTAKSGGAEHPWAVRVWSAEEPRVR